MSDRSSAETSATEHSTLPPGRSFNEDAPADVGPDNDDAEIELAVVTMTFQAEHHDAANAQLLAVLAKYTVLSRMADGCRNVDLCSSVTSPGRHLIVQKWESADLQRAHFDSDLMVDMAQSCQGILATAPHIDLWDGTSAHDLR